MHIDVEAGRILANFLDQRGIDIVSTALKLPTEVYYDWAGDTGRTSVYVVGPHCVNIVDCYVPADLVLTLV
jgi:hypothetical protein